MESKGEQRPQPKFPGSWWLILHSTTISHIISHMKCIYVLVSALVPANIWPLTLVRDTELLKSFNLPSEECLTQSFYILWNVLGDSNMFSSKEVTLDGLLDRGWSPERASYDQKLGTFSSTPHSP